MTDSSEHLDAALMLANSFHCADSDGKNAVVDRVADDPDVIRVLLQLVSDLHALESFSVATSDLIGTYRRKLINDQYMP
jgi:hypothetical protein